jgi:hypothetical protein
LIAVCAWLESAPALCFHNESGLVVPHVLVRGGSPLVRTETIKRLRSVKRETGVAFTVTHTGDGITRTFRVE